MWIEHDRVFYNLEGLRQIERQEDLDILLTTLEHNGIWQEIEDMKIITLSFETTEKREEFMFFLGCKLKVCPFEPVIYDKEENE